MPDYVVTDPKTGKKLKLTGDKPPSVAELDQIFSQQSAKSNPTFFDALKTSVTPRSENAAMQALETAGNIISIPTRIGYSAIQAATGRDTFTGALASKTEAGKVLFGENDSFKSIAADILLDPMNFISGAGIAKVGKLFSKTSKVSNLAEVAKVGGYTERSLGAIETIKTALKKVPSARSKQEFMYSAERSELAKGMDDLAKKFSGEELHIQQKSLIAKHGEFKKVQFESVAKEVGQDDVNELYSIVENSKLHRFDKLTAKEGLSRLLGARGTNLPTRSQAAMLAKVLPDDLMKEIADKRTFVQKLWGGTADALNLPRALMATADLSAPLRQGVFLIRRQKQFAPAFKEMFKYAFSPKAYDGLMDDIAKRPNYNLMRDSKLALTDLGGDLLKREEEFMSNLAEKIPLFGRVAKGSNRAYSGFLNKMRADVFDDLINKAGKQGLDVRALSDDIASYVNAATGRGSLGKFEKAAPFLNATLFSPRLIASRVQLVGKVFSRNTSSFVRKEALKDWAGFLGMGSTVLGLAKLGGAEVGLDPRSSDFGKIKFGDTRYDIWGGFQQYSVLMSRILTGEMVNSLPVVELTISPVSILDINTEYCWNPPHIS